jgi:hypothetical protein
MAQKTRAVEIYKLEPPFCEWDFFSFLERNPHRALKTRPLGTIIKNSMVP